MAKFGITTSTLIVNVAYYSQAMNTDAYNSSHFSSPTTDNQTTVESNHTSSNGSSCSWNQLQPIHQDIDLDSLTMQHNEPSIPGETTSPMNNTPIVSTNSVKYYPNYNNGIPVDPLNYPKIPYSSQPIPNSYSYTSMNGYAPNNEPVNVSVAIPPAFRPVNPGARFCNQHASRTTKTASKETDKPKRDRTAFTTEQILVLEKEYSSTRYVNRSRRLQLGNLLCLTEKKIKVWFQNRRMKEKKNNAKRCEEPCSTQTDPNMLVSHEQYQSIPNNLFNQRVMYMEHIPPANNYVQVPVDNLPPIAEQVPPVHESMYADFNANVNNGDEQCQEDNLQLQQFFQVTET